MHSVFLNELVVVLALATGVLVLCHRLHIPPVVGFLLTGVLAGPHGLNLSGSKNEIETVRFLDITVRWMNEEGVIREREVKGQAAQTIQQIDVVQRGEGSCQDSSTEAAIAVLTKKVNDLRLQMLHGTPDNIAMLSAEQVQQYLRNNNNQRQLPR